MRCCFCLICTNADFQKISRQFTIDNVRKNAYNNIWKEVIYLLQDNLKKLREERGLTKQSTDAAASASAKSLNFM